MSYIDKSLGAGERVVARAHFHWLYTVGAVLALILLGVILVGIVMFVTAMIHKGTTEVAVTNRRFILKKGLFTLNTREFALSNIEGVRVHQGFWGRMFGYGQITVEGTGVDSIKTPKMIAHPIELRSAIETAKDGGA